MSNPTVSLRISNFQLARGLQAIRAIEPTWKLTTVSDLVRTVFNDYIAKAEHQHKLSFDVPPDILHEVEQARIASTVANTKSIALARAKALAKVQPTLGQPTVNQIAMLGQLNHVGQPVPTDNRTAQQRRLDDEGEQIRKEMQAEKALETAKANQLSDDEITEQIKLSKAKPQPFNALSYDPSEEPETDSDTSGTVSDFSPPEHFKR